MSEYKSPIQNLMTERDALRQELNILRNENEQLKKNQCKCPTTEGELREVVGDKDPVQKVEFLND